MSYGKTVLGLLLAGLLASEACAQQGDAAERQRAEQAQAAEMQQRAAAEEEQQRANEARAAEGQRRAAERDAANIEAELRAAEARLEAAARQIAELSTRRLPQFEAQHFNILLDRRPMLGITIEDESGDGPADGVRVNGVTPGGPAFEAGLRAGDVITAINGEALSADSSVDANEKLLDFMEGVEEGDALDIGYLRDGDAQQVTVTPDTLHGSRFVFNGGMGRPPRAPGAPPAPSAPPAPLAPGFSDFVFMHGQGGWSDLEMVPLTEDLGRYFGTDKGLLVVRAPTDDYLTLKDGDVIHAIDGREPKSVSHAVRILASYRAGEALKIDIMRNKRRMTLDVDVPDPRQGAFVPGAGVERRRVVEAE